MAAAAAPTPAAPSAALRWRARACEVGADGTCAATGRSLLVKDVSDADRAELCSVIPRLIGSRAKGAEFRAFADYVRERGPFEYVIDGANIGFYGQGKAVNDGAKAAAAAAEEADLPPPTKAALHEAKHARFLYPQLDALLRAVCARSQRVLLVLHVSHTKEEEMDPIARELVLRWRQAGVLFTSPAGHNDDWYWLYAAMASGRGCRVVSNDEMRDHHFGMLAPRSFLRWKERHVVHFAFPRRANGSPELAFPPPFSSVAQPHGEGRWLLPCADSPEWLLVEPADEGGAAV